MLVTGMYLFVDWVSRPCISLADQHSDSVTCTGTLTASVRMHGSAFEGYFTSLKELHNLGDIILRKRRNLSGSLIHSVVMPNYSSLTAFMNILQYFCNKVEVVYGICKAKSSPLLNFVKPTFALATKSCPCHLTLCCRSFRYNLSWCTGTIEIEGVIPF